MTLTPAGVASGAAATGGEAVDVRGLSYRYPGASSLALDEVDLALAAGERVVVAGPSGSGKSTLARVLASLLRPLSGSVRIGGADTGGMRPQAVARHLGLVFQDPNHQLLTGSVREELALGPANLGLASGAVDDRVGTVAARLGLESLLHIHPYRLALADRKRVALGAVLTMCPSVLVLDEPTSGQAPDGTDRLARVIGDEAAGGTAVIVVTHDMRFAAEVADRLVVLVAGRVRADAVPDAIFRDERLLHDAGLEPPQVARLCLRLGLAEAVPVTADPARLADRIRAARAARTGGQDGPRPGG